MATDISVMTAPLRFAAWMTAHQHKDPELGHVYRYHSRSDAHSIALCEEIVVDLLERSESLRHQAAQGVVCYDINCRFTWPTSRKTKTLDLAIGPAADPLPPAGGARIRRGRLSDVYVACEAKTVMTEHSKSRPRVYDELSSSHQIVHAGRHDAIAAGITVVNIAQTFVSPLRQRTPGVLQVSEHKQPHAARNIIEHLRGLPIREDIHATGFDAYASIIIDCDNLHDVRLWSDPPAPQPGDPDHYDTFIARIARFYDVRFGRLAFRRF